MMADLKLFMLRCAAQVIRPGDNPGVGCARVASLHPKATGGGF